MANASALVGKPLRTRVVVGLLLMTAFVAGAAPPASAMCLFESETEEGYDENGNPTTSQEVGCNDDQTLICDGDAQCLQGPSCVDDMSCQLPPPPPVPCVTDSSCPIPMIPCVDGPCDLPPLPGVTVIPNGDATELAATPELTVIDNPVAVIGSVKLTIAPETSITTVAVGQNDPCDIVGQLFACSLNPLVPPTILEAVEGDFVPGPSVCLQPVRFSVDVNSDGFEDFSAGGFMPAVNEC